MSDAIEAVTRFCDAYEAMAQRTDDFHGLHVGTEREAVLRISDMRQVLAENADLKSSVVAFCGPWAVHYAKERGLPPGHLIATHYDILERAGARMIDFVRAPDPS